MIINNKTVLEQIDLVIRKTPKVHENSLDEQISEANTSLHSIIHRLSPIGSKHISNADETIKRYSVSNSYAVNLLLGILKSLRSEYELGTLQSIQELIHADVFSDFLDMAEHLLNEGYKDPAAVIVGSVLEGHLRKLALRVGLSVTKSDGSAKKADTLNAELAGNLTISKLDQKNVIAWLDLRNNAAHGHYDKYTKEQVSLLITSVRDFITRNPA